MKSNATLLTELHALEVDLRCSRIDFDNEHYIAGSEQSAVSGVGASSTPTPPLVSDDASWSALIVFACLLGFVIVCVWTMWAG